MPNSKSIGSIVFYIFIIIFIVLAYLNNNGTLSSLFPKKTTTVNKNIIQMEFKEKEYKADYTKILEGTAIKIANFEAGEKWTGDFNIDDRENYWEGESSYIVLAKNNQSNIISLRKSIDLSDSLMIKILVHSANQENINNIEKATLRFGNPTDTAYYEYDIRNIKQGWSIIEMPKENFSFVTGTASTEEGNDKNITNDRLWSSIGKISLELKARPNTQVELSFDRLWAEKNDLYKKEFLTNNFDMLSPVEWNRKNYLNFWSIGASLSVFSKVTGVRNFTYTAKIIPQRVGTFGINGRTDLSTTYGYYLELGGIGTGTWQLYKIGEMIDTSSTIVLDNGSIANFQIEADQPLWLRLSISGNTIIGYMSIDNKNFTKLTEKNDSEHKSGGIGLQTAGSILLESVEFQQ